MEIRATFADGFICDYYVLTALIFYGFESVKKNVKQFILFQPGREMQ